MCYRKICLLIAIFYFKGWLLVGDSLSSSIRKEIAWAAAYARCHASQEVSGSCNCGVELQPSVLVDLGLIFELLCDFLGTIYPAELLTAMRYYCDAICWTLFTFMNVKQFLLGFYHFFCGRCLYNVWKCIAIRSHFFKLLVSRAVCRVAAVFGSRLIVYLMNICRSWWVPGMLYVVGNMM